MTKNTSTPRNPPGRSDRSVRLFYNRTAITETARKPSSPGRYGNWARGARSAKESASWRPNTPHLTASACDRHDRIRELPSRERTEERLVREVEDATVGADHQVTVAVPHHADHGVVQVPATHRAAERGIAEREDSAVGGDHPIAAVG